VRIWFSGESGVDDDSAIDMIRAAEPGSQEVLEIQLTFGREEVDFGQAGRDLLEEGLVLNSTNSPARIILDGGGRVIDLKGAPAHVPAPLITVRSGVTLTLRNITFKGLKKADGDTADNNASLIKVDSGELIMEAGDIHTPAIKDNVNSVGGGGVYVDNGGSFTMNAGIIDGNTASSSSGGGVYVYRDGGFTMNGGTISGNTAFFSGGGVFITGTDSNLSGGNFTMNGGDISGNTAVSYSGGGVFVYRGGGFTMKDGNISGNHAASYGGGVYIDGGTVTMEGGNIGDNETTSPSGGGGVFVMGSFTMEGGNISGNKTASQGNGGGVYVNSGSFIMKNGTTINYNTADSGGGVYVYGGNFTINGGTISDNTASLGGGVYVNGSGRFTKNGGTVTGNTNGDVYP
jgi:hypothetical protein